MALADAIRSLIVFTTDAPFESDDFITKLIPNFWDFIIQLCAFIVLIVLVFFIAYKPVKKFIDKRKKYISENISEAEKAKKEGLEFKKVNEEGVEEAKKEGKRIILEAKEDASKEAEKIRSEAREEASKIVETAKKEGELAKEKSRAEAKEEIVNLAILASEKLLERQVEKKDEEKLLSDFIDDVEKGAS